MPRLAGGFPVICGVSGWMELSKPNESLPQNQNNRASERPGLAEAAQERFLLH